VSPFASIRARRLLAVWLGLIVAVLYLPLAIALLVSFGRSGDGLPWAGFSLHWYRAAYAVDSSSASSSIWRSAWNSLWVGALVATIDTSLALLLTYGAARLPRPRVRATLIALCLLPLAVPAVAYGAIMLVLFRHGPIRLGFGLDLVVVAHVLLFLPIAVLLVYPRMAAIPGEIWDSAEDLGAGRTALLRRVAIPLCGSALVLSLLITFLFSFNEPVVASWLVNRDVTYPVYLFQFGRGGPPVPLVAATASAAYPVVIPVLVALWLMRRRRP
jgi:ABC-type spermidine/putrescine transport system permease subunit II